MLEYKIVSADSLGSLQVNINAYLAQGWELRGDVQILYLNPQASFYVTPTIFQVMTKSK